MAFGRSDPNALVAAFASSDFSGDEAAWQEAVEQESPPDELAIPEMDADGNYTSPVLERVLQAYDAYLQDKSQRRSLNQVLESTQAGLEKLLNTMDLCIEEGLDEPTNPIHQAARAGFEEFLQGLDLLQQSVEQRKGDLAESAFDLLQQATNRLMDAYAFFQKLRNTLMTVYCPACGAENRRGSPKCGACQTAIPQQETLSEGRLVAENAEGVLQSEAAPPPLTTPNYQRIEVALERWQRQELDDDGLWAEISGVETNMLGHRKVNKAEMDDLEGLTEEEQEVTLRLLGGIDVALEGSLAALADMKLYWDDGNPDHLTRGMAALGPPTQKMIECFLALQSINVEEEQAES